MRRGGEEEFNNLVVVQGCGSLSKEDKPSTMIVLQESMRDSQEFFDEGSGRLGFLDVSMASEEGASDMRGYMHEARREMMGCIQENRMVLEQEVNKIFHQLNDTIHPLPPLSTL